MEVIGTIKVIYEEKQYGSNNFRKRELILVTNEQYSQSLRIEFVQDKCDLLNNYEEGQFVTININLRGREWVNEQGESIYFNSIQGWRISVNNNQTEQDTPPANQNLNNLDDDPDDLPF